MTAVLGPASEAGAATRITTSATGSTALVSPTRALAVRDSSAALPGTTVEDAGAPVPGALSVPVRTFRGRIGLDVSDVSGQSASWSVWHAFRRHFDPATGAAVTADHEVPGAMVPVPARIEISYFYADAPTVACPEQSVQSDRDGSFEFTLAPCPADQPYRTPDMIVARAVLDYEIRGPLRRRSRSVSSLGTVRATWNREEAEALYRPHAGAVVYTREGGTVDYVNPSFTVVYEPHALSQPAAGDAVFDLGIRDLRSNFSSPAEGYLSYVISNWQKLVELHHRLRAEFLAVDDVATYRQVFVDHNATNCFGCYNIEFDSPDSFAWGGPGIMVLAAPAENIVWSDSAGAVAHEFGHGVHSTIAPSSSGSHLRHYSFAGGNIDSNGEAYYRQHQGWQHQEMGTAYIEGIATALGEALVGGCNEPWRPSYVTGGPPPAGDETLRPYESCDDGARCTYHNFRWHMTQRGISERSEEWDRRQQLGQSAESAYSQASQYNLIDGSRRYVTSNSESRYSLFACDLLRSGSDITHDSGERAGLEYLYDSYPYLMGRAHDGFEASYEVRSYDQDVQPKTFQLSLPELLEAMEGFFDADTVLPELGDPTYPARRLSVRADLAPQTLGLYMVDRGWLTRDELNNVLRANYMQEATWYSPGEQEGIQANLEEDLPLLVLDPELGPAPVLSAPAVVNPAPFGVANPGLAPTSPTSAPGAGAFQLQIQ
jgi:hypothetical protein